MSTDEFERLLNKPESTVIDFKEAQYKFVSDIKTAEFVKDIVCFVNSIRTEPAYIILGVRANVDGTKELLGIGDHLDDSILQEKVKDKVYPKPNFLYFTFNHNGLTFGLVKIPVCYYPEPIAPVVKMKGLEAGKVYIRRGSSNAEAIGKEVILINNWMVSLPKPTTDNNMLGGITTILLEVTSNKKSLSECIAFALRFAKDNNLEELYSFCKGELTGWEELADRKEIKQRLGYRDQKVLVTPFDIKINPHYQYGADHLYKELQSHKDVSELKMCIPFSISKIEEAINNFTQRGNNTIATFTIPGNNFFHKGQHSNINVKIFVFRDTYENLYSSIKQEFINLLMKVD